MEDSNSGAQISRRFVTRSEVDALLGFFEVVVSSTDINRYNLSSVASKLGTCTQTLQKIEGTERLQQTISLKLLCSSCCQALPSVELPCDHRFCLQCFQALVGRHGLGRECQATCFCGAPIKPADLERLPSLASRFNVDSHELCKNCQQKPCCTFHSCLCDNCLGEVHRQSLTACPYCGGKLGKEAELTDKCYVCRLEMPEPCVLSTECCPRLVCVLCQLEREQSVCVSCMYPLQPTVLAQLEKAKEHLVLLHQRDPLLFE